MKIRGYEVVPGSARRYKNIYSGETISRWQMQKMQHEGYNPREVAAKNKEIGKILKGVLKGRIHNEFVRKHKESESKRLGVKPSQVKVRGQSAAALEFKQKTAAYKAVLKTRHKLHKELGKKKLDPLRRLEIEHALSDYRQVRSALGDLGVDADEFEGYEVKA